MSFLDFFLVVIFCTVNCVTKIRWGAGVLGIPEMQNFGVVKIMMIRHHIIAVVNVLIV